MQSCDEYDPAATTVEDARQRMVAAALDFNARDTASPCETLRLFDEPIRGVSTPLGRVLAEPLMAALNVPSYPVSAMDGYAVCPDDPHDQVRTAVGPDDRVAFLRVGTSAAGRPFSGTLHRGECVRILTGAVVPASADRVVMQENARVDGDQVHVLLPNADANIRHVGEDTRRGAELFPAGTVLGPLQLGVIASQGIESIRLRPRPRVAFLSTGDEVIQTGKPLGPGQLYDSNRQTLRALLATLPVEPLDFGILPDDPKAIAAALDAAGAQADAVIASGGASVGDTDFVTRLLAERGQVEFWKLAMKPGRPLAFGHFGRALFFGLPGNPVAVAATFALLVRPALQTLAGMQVTDPATVTARLTHSVRKTPGRTDYQRAIHDPVRGEVTSLSGQGSHQLHHMARANAFIVLPRAADGAEADAIVDVLPFTALGLLPPG